MKKQHPRLDCYVSIDGLVKTGRSKDYKPLRGTSIRKSGKLGYCGGTAKDRITGQRRAFLVHRIVWETFVGEIPEGLQINHKDGNKLNNHLSNLEVVTPKENMRHAVRTGLKPAQQAEDASMSKLSNQQFYNLIDDMVHGASNDDCAEKYGLHPRYISLIRHRKRVKTIWNLYEKNTGIGCAPKSDGLLSKIPMETRVNIISQLPNQTNKALARSIDVDPSVISNVRYKKTWLDAWKIFEEGALGCDMVCSTRRLVAAIVS